MANGAIGGGIGAGILTGLQFMRQRDSDARADQALQMQGQRLQMDQDMHGAKMGELNRANDERNRLDMYNNLQTQVESVYGTGADALPEYDRKKMVIDKALGAGIIKPAELELAKKSYDSAIQLAGVDAYDAATKRGDLTPLNKILASKGFGTAAAGSDGTITITGANGQAQQFKPSDLLNLQIMAGAYDREAARAKAALDARKKEADITRTIADAGRLDRMPQDRFGIGVGVRGTGSGKGKQDTIDPIKDLKDFNAAIGLGPDKQPYPWAPTALQHYKQMMAENPDIAGTETGAQYALNMAQALGKGVAQAVPEIDKDGNINLVASWPGVDGKSSPRKINLQRNIDPAGVTEAQGVGGNLAVKPEEWLKVQDNAVQTYAKTRPDEYRIAAEASGDDAKMAALAEKAKTSQDAARALRFAKITRELNHAQRAPSSKARSGKPPLSPEDQKLADTLGYDPNGPGVIDMALDVGNRFLNSARGVFAAANGDQFEAAIRMAKRTPDMPGVRQKLFEMARGNPSRMARIQAEFGAGHGR